MMEFTTRGVYLLWLFVYGSQGWLFEEETDRVCYTGWGCFRMDPPFNNTGFLPRSPTRLGVTFRFYTDATNYQTAGISDTVEHILSRNIFVPNIPTKIIIHGFQDTADNEWVRRMVRELARKERMNIIAVDWRRGAATFNYLQAAADARLIGKFISSLLLKLEQLEASSTNCHVIGHSLGAHIAGYVGIQIRNLGRITGLDPAGPAFENTMATVRLDASDAAFVDVIHTDSQTVEALGLGVRHPSGQADFYPNGGRDQPGCASSLNQLMDQLLRGSSIVRSVGCSHMRATELFTESINSPCEFTANPCPSFNQISPTRCVGCGQTGCAQMGYHADATNPSGIFFLTTNQRRPFCRNQ